MHDVLQSVSHFVSHHRLGACELAVLQVLVAARGRVVSRSEIMRSAGMKGRPPATCDKALVNVRRAVGPSVLQNVRRRGWRVDVDAMARSNL